MRKRKTELIETYDRRGNGTKEKKLQIILDNYAHDYRGIAMDDVELKTMLWYFLEEVVEEIERDIQKRIDIIADTGAKSPTAQDHISGLEYALQQLAEYNV